MSDKTRYLRNASAAALLAVGGTIAADSTGIISLANIFDTDTSQKMAAECDEMETKVATLAQRALDNPGALPAGTVMVLRDLYNDNTGNNGGCNFGADSPAALILEVPLEGLDA